MLLPYRTFIFSGRFFQKQKNSCLKLQLSSPDDKHRYGLPRNLNGSINSIQLILGVNSFSRKSSAVGLSRAGHLHNTR